MAFTDFPEDCMPVFRHALARLAALGDRVLLGYVHQLHALERLASRPEVAAGRMP